MTELGLDKPVQDVEAAIEELKKRGAKKVAVTGFCWGGTITWLAATRLKPDAVIGLLRRRHPWHQEREAQVPTMMHFGDKDMHIPMTHVNELRKLHPDVQIFDYPADHGFHCDERGSYDAAASKQAMAADPGVHEEARGLGSRQRSPSIRQRAAPSTGSASSICRAWSPATC